MAARLSAASGVYDTGHNSEINVTPFVDVMLVLLIIFMVAAPLATSALKVDLPTTPPLTPVEPKSPITVSITSDGGVYVNDRLTAIEALAPAVRSLIADGTHEDRVVVRADKTVSYERFIQTMSTLNLGGVGKLSLMSEVAS